MNHNLSRVNFLFTLLVSTIIWSVKWFQNAGLILIHITFYCDPKLLTKSTFRCMKIQTASVNYKIQFVKPISNNFHTFEP